ncbi:hypothetical protein NQ318_014349 [Aromia moschata]|uniref:Uncharacterized protein n=1 Tax=Aromia moschata TaxID=1265417 RepID=A0AAV8YYW2_9CUCU|nr:hypothetical protein NQ318_014349 [Aromia moschata]
MKLLLIFAAVFFGTTLAQVEVGEEIVEGLLTEIFKDLVIDIPPQVVEHLKSHSNRKISTTDHSDDSEYVVAKLNDFIDQVFENIKEQVANSSTNSLSVPNLSLKLDDNGGQLNLTNGLLEDIFYLKRNGDVELEYNVDENVLNLTLPIQLDDVKYHFNYDTKVVLLHVVGGLHGTIKNVKIDISLSFDLNTFHAALVHYDMNDTGSITISFTGNSVVDWLLDAISAVITTILHPLIVDILQKAISGVISNIVETINNAVDGIFNPTTIASAIGNLA